MAEDPRVSTRTDVFPWIVTVGSLAVGLWVFFSSTVDAVREKEMLDAASQKMVERRNSLRDRAVQLRAERNAIPTSPDLLIREMDRRGVLPHEIQPPIDESLNPPADPDDPQGHR